MPFCKGCGHSHVVRQLNKALIRLGVSPSEVCLVTDIGCIGLADSMFESVHTVHTTHGRSTAFATGLQIADSVLANGHMKTIVLIGDGGAMIGLQHIVNAALMNVDLTVLVCNNFLFGMTGGQNSAFSPYEFVTPTTPRGNIVPPLDICRVISDCGSEFVARALATEKDLDSTIAAAVSHPGFAIVEIVELCTEHATEVNAITGKTLNRILESHNQRLGLLSGEPSRTDFAGRYTGKYSMKESVLEERFISPTGNHRLTERLRIVLAGSAGEHIQYAAKKLCDAAMAAGLCVTQKNDNPVTQGFGFSISEVILSPEEIFYTGVEVPDVVVIVSADGARELHENGTFSAMDSKTILITDTEIDVPKVEGPVFVYSFRKEYGPAHAAERAIAFYLRKSDIFSTDLYRL